MGWRLELIASLKVVDQIKTMSVLGNNVTLDIMFCEIPSVCMYANCLHTGLNKWYEK